MQETPGHPPWALFQGRAAHMAALGRGVPPRLALRAHQTNSTLAAERVQLTPHQQRNIAFYRRRSGRRHAWMYGTKHTVCLVYYARDTHEGIKQLLAAVQAASDPEYLDEQPAHRREQPEGAHDPATG
ncbi:hypothetical protein WJX81_002034 [Elliptochloris bilobata]|uniref:Uncharacterized protein n=1 Tax=Elliptochloris bilobata TaxID=381761 RepID=A0AAW1QWR2_9CHLO